jgi:hypothetical protein
MRLRAFAADCTGARRGRKPFSLDFVSRGLFALSTKQESALRAGKKNAPAKEELFVRVQKIAARVLVAFEL